MVFLKHEQERVLQTTDIYPFNNRTWQLQKFHFHDETKEKNKTKEICILQRKCEKQEFHRIRNIGEVWLVCDSLITPLSFKEHTHAYGTYYTRDVE